MTWIMHKYDFEIESIQTKIKFLERLKKKHILVIVFFTILGIWLSVGLIIFLIRGEPVGLYSIVFIVLIVLEFILCIKRYKRIKIINADVKDLNESLLKYTRLAFKKKNNQKIL